MSTAATVSLRSLAENKTEGITKQTTFRVNPELVTFEEGFNVRSDDDTLAAHIDRLFEAMKNGASVPPVDVRVDDDGTVVCVDGHSRTMAALRMKKEVPEFTLEARHFRGNEQDRVLHMLGTGSGQKPLTPLEQGIGFLRLVKYGMTAIQIAAKLGVSRVTIDNGLALAEAPVEVQQMVRDGTVSSTTAREALKQGAEGVQALKDAAATPDAPTPANGKAKKPSNKKKVTAAKLKGTAAKKKTSKKASKKDLQFVGANSDAGKGKPAPHVVADESGIIPEGEVLVKVNKEQAQAVIEFLRANAPDDAQPLKDFAAALEVACM